jgi:hypothetical protein
MDTVKEQHVPGNGAGRFPLPIRDWREGPSFNVRIWTVSRGAAGSYHPERNKYSERNFDFFKYKSSGGLVRFRRMRWHS